MADLVSILTQGMRLGASDIIITPECPPMCKLNGQVAPLGGHPVLDQKTASGLIYSALDDANRARFEQDWELDYSFAVEGTARIRANIFIQKSGVSAIYRIIRSKIPSPEEIDLTPEMVALADLPRGLVLVSGPPGSGKSTTVACLLELINRKYKKSILTIEDPIEYIYENKNSLILQREVGQHTRSFSEALRRALRQSSDVIMVGELRDLETIMLAVTAAETGHLCFATLHTKSASSTIDRLVDVFPAAQQDQIRCQLSFTLEAVISQLLMPRKDGRGRVAAREFMLATHGVSTLLREGESHMIYSAISTNRKHGMMTLDQHLAELAFRGIIREEDALAKAQYPENFKQTLKFLSTGK